MEKITDMVGALTANIYMLLVIVVFILRISGQPEIGSWIGIASTLALLPFLYLFVLAFRTNQRRIYFIWLGLIILFILFELVVDHIMGIDFRSRQWSVIAYVMFFCAATGGMIGVASQAGNIWARLTTIVFLIMVALSFVQRAIIGI